MSSLGGKAAFRARRPLARTLSPALTVHRRAASRDDYLFRKIFNCPLPNSSSQRADSLNARGRRHQCQVGHEINKMQELEPRKRRGNFCNAGKSFPDPAGTEAGLIKSNETSFSSAHTKRSSSTVTSPRSAEFIFRIRCRPREWLLTFRRRTKNQTDKNNKQQYDSGSMLLDAHPRRRSAR